MPFAHCAGGISGILQHISHGDAGCVDDKFRVSGSNAGVLLPPGIHTSEESETGRSTGGRGGVSIGELYSLSGETVDIRSTHFGCSVTTQVADTEVVCEYINNVGLLTVLSIALLRCVVTSG